LLATELEVWLLIGSLGLKTQDPDGRFANRSFLITPTGEIAASYDKIKSVQRLAALPAVV
jgi:predicted amidohydrolase